MIELFALLYLYLAILVTLGVRADDDPYGQPRHGWRPWMEAILVGILWLPVGVYSLVAMVIRSFQG